MSDLRFMHGLTWGVLVSCAVTVVLLFVERALGIGVCL